MTPEQQARNLLVGDVTNIEMRFVVRHEAAYDMPEDGDTREVRRLQWRCQRVTYTTYPVNCSNSHEDYCMRKTDWDEWADVPLVIGA